MAYEDEYILMSRPLYRWPIQMGRHEYVIDWPVDASMALVEEEEEIHYGHTASKGL